MTAVMKCPICRNSLVSVGGGAMWCSSRHGLAVDRAILNEANRHFVGPHLRRIDSSVPPGAVARARALRCPNCREQMIEVDYRGSGTMIDVCLECPYRWLDGGELTKIAEFESWPEQIGIEELDALGRIGQARK
jgi:Zn-finger nucleic acid-binding protein